MSKPFLITMFLLQLATWVFSFIVHVRYSVPNRELQLKRLMISSGFPEDTFWRMKAWIISMLGLFLEVMLASLFLFTDVKFFFSIMGFYALTVGGLFWISFSLENSKHYWSAVLGKTNGCLLFSCLLLYVIVKG